MRLRSLPRYCEQRLLAFAQLEQLAAVVKGEFVRVLAGTVDDDSFGLRKGPHGVLNSGGQGKRSKRILFKGPCASTMPGPEKQDVPSSRRRVFNQAAQLPLFVGIVRCLVGRIDPILAIDCRFGPERRESDSGPGVSEIETRHILVEDQRPDDQAPHAPVGPGVERPFVVGEPLFQREDHIHPGDQGFGRHLGCLRRLFDCADRGQFRLGTRRRGLERLASREQMR